MAAKGVGIDVVVVRAATLVSATVAWGIGATAAADVEVVVEEEEEEGGESAAG